MLSDWAAVPRGEHGLCTGDGFQRAAAEPCAVQFPELGGL